MEHGEQNCIYEAAFRLFGWTFTVAEIMALNDPAFLQKRNWSWSGHISFREGAFNVIICRDHRTTRSHSTIIGGGLGLLMVLGRVPWGWIGLDAGRCWM